MRILLTNDDGLHAPGLVALAHSLRARRPDDDLMIVAPSTVQSATSHGLTIDAPLHVAREPMGDGLEGIAVEGRPADCTKVALGSLWRSRFGAHAPPPDVVISGINMGSNCGVNHHYSGTVAAAMEASLQGIPSLAFSLLLSAAEPRYDVAAEWSCDLVEWLTRDTVPRDTCLSINLPAAESDRPLPAVRVCPMNIHPLVDAYERRWNPRGGEYLWPAGDFPAYAAIDESTDVARVDAGLVAITPMVVDRTAHDQLDHWRDRLEGER